SDDVFTWDDVVRISRPETLLDNPSDLKGYSEEIKICNRAFLDKLYNTFSPLPNRNRPIVRLSEFLCFVIEDQIVGYIHKGSARIP
ncbi:PREDICTED: nudix hydrolase, partial [Prunus dulcis]